MKTLVVHKTKITKDKITIFGCGKFGESSKTLNKIEAALLYADLHKFLKNRL